MTSGEFIVAFDPGGTTGIATYKDGVFAKEQIGPDEHHQALWEWMHEHRPTTVCYERFTYQVRKKNEYAHAHVNLIPREYIGLFKLYGATENIELVARHASEVKKLWTDDKLKVLGLYSRNMGHANDAIRHLLSHLVLDKKMKHLLQPLKPTD